MEVEDKPAALGSQKAQVMKPVCVSVQLLAIASYDTVTRQVDFCIDNAGQ